MKTSMQVFHGSNWKEMKEFFVPTKYRDHGLFFVDSEQTALNYALNKSEGIPVILVGHIQLSNPYYLKDDQLNNYVDHYLQGELGKFYQKIKDENYDGVIFPNHRDGIEVAIFNSQSYSPLGYKTLKEGKWVFQKINE
jgi:hypothetical protein